MSAPLTHLAVGLLIGVALRLPLKYLPLAALMGAAADFDQLGKYAGVPFLRSRVHGHNIFFTIVVPVLVFVFLTWRGAKPEYRQLAAASPVLLSSHLFIDLVQFEPLGAGGAAALLWPFTETFYTLEYRLIGPRSPTQYSTLGVVLMSLTLVAVLSIVAFRLADHRERAGRRKQAVGVAAAYALVWFLLLPGLAAADAITDRPDYPNASLGIAGAELHLPHGRVVATAVNQGGYTAGAGMLTLQVLQGDEVIAEAASRNAIGPGERTGFDIPLGENARSLGALEVQLVATKSPDLVYASAPVTLVQSHIDVPFRMSAARSGSLLTATEWNLDLQNAGAESVPPGAVRLTVTARGSTLADETNPRILFAGGNWRVTFEQPAAPEARVILRSVDDGHVYLDESVRLVGRVDVNEILG